MEGGGVARAFQQSPGGLHQDFQVQPQGACVHILAGITQLGGQYFFGIGALRVCAARQQRAFVAVGQRGQVGDPGRTLSTVSRRAAGYSAT